MFVYGPFKKALDEFALTQTAEYRRSYRRFLFALHGVAYLDFAEGSVAERVAWAWEDAQITAVGGGDASLTGAWLGMWAALRNKRAEKEFFAVVRDSLNECEDQTPVDIPRRYLEGSRRKPVRHPRDGFRDPVAVPVRGVRLQEWAIVSGEDYETVEADLMLLEALERQEREEEPPPAKRRAHLRLVQ